MLDLERDYIGMNLLFFLCAHFAGTGETGSSGDGEHSRAPADVKSFSNFIPATHSRVWSANTYVCGNLGLLGNFQSHTPPNTTTLLCAWIERVKEFLRDVEGVPGHCDHCAHTFFIEEKKQKKTANVI